jgi:hypothetical protein
VLVVQVMPHVIRSLNILNSKATNQANKQRSPKQLNYITPLLAH